MQSNLWSVKAKPYLKKLGSCDFINAFLNQVLFGNMGLKDV